MSEPERQLPRFIPTLTEIVDPASYAPTPAVAPPDLDAVMQSVRQQLLPLLERRIQEEFDKLVHAQVAAACAQTSQRLHSEWDGLMRQVIAEHLGAGKLPAASNIPGA